MSGSGWCLIYFSFLSPRWNCSFTSFWCILWFCTWWWSRSLLGSYIWRLWLTYWWWIWWFGAWRLWMINSIGGDKWIICFFWMRASWTKWIAGGSGRMIKSICWRTTIVRWCGRRMYICWRAVIVIFIIEFHVPKSAISNDICLVSNTWPIMMIRFISISPTIIDIVSALNGRNKSIHWSTLRVNMLCLSRS